MEMKYASTRGKAEAVDAAQAILQGIAGDGGLFVPTEIPKTDGEFWQGLTTLSDGLYGGGNRRLHRRRVWRRKI